MSDISGVYNSARSDLAKLLQELPEEDLNREVPATAGWTIRDIAAHLAADATCVINADFPAIFFESFGEPRAVVALNEWTARQVSERKDRSLQELLDEWDRSGEKVAAMMRQEESWPEGIPWFADRVLTTDVAVHQQDIYGALGIERDRDAPQVKIGLAGYIATMGLRTGSKDLPALRFEAGEKSWDVGVGEPAATVNASRWELFRAMSGRRSPDQIRAYDWDGDPEPFIPYFYPYGVRDEALGE